MKIKEIINEALVQPTQTVDEPLSHEYDLDDLYRQRQKRDISTDDPRLLHLYDKDEGKDNATGWYSYGKEADNPHEYNVRTHQPSKIHLDAKYIWVKSIMPLMGDNPYVPVYYNINLEPDKKGINRISYTMEKLYGIQQLKNMYFLSMYDAISSPEEATEAKNEINTRISKMLISMMSRVMGIEEAKYFKNKEIDLIRGIKNLSWDEASRVFHLEPNQIWEKFVLSLESAVGKRNLNYDAEMIEVLNIVNDLRISEGLTVDIHPGNVMLRNTNVGLVPVITDPLSDDGRSIIGKKY